MRDVRVTVAGGGVAGLATALLLARDGHRVTLLERDAFTIGAAEGAPSWQRRGIPHFSQPHAFIPRGRQEMRDGLPDVYAALLDVGARDVDLRHKLPGPTVPQDELLQYLAVRRPIIEWGLRQAVSMQAGIDVRDGSRVTGLDVEDGRAVTLRVDGVRLPADLVVDAMGRRTPLRSWMAEQGVVLEPGERSPCGVVYYSRYYRTLPGRELPDGPWILSPRGDVGYLGFSTFPGDNGTFAAVFAVPTGRPDWRILNHAAAFEKAVAQIPQLAMWADPANVEPITDVLPMGGLYNTLDGGPAGSPTGVLPVGDALGHTDPFIAHGLAFSLIHARAAAVALREQDLGDVEAAYRADVMPALRERYDFATALDAQRYRLWVGDPVDFAHHDRDYQLFSQYAAAAAATVDPDVFRVFIRRIGLLDSTTVLDTDLALRQRVEAIFAELRAQPRPPLGPPRDEMLARLGAEVTSLDG